MDYVMCGLNWIQTTYRNISVLIVNSCVKPNLFNDESNMALLVKSELIASKRLKQISVKNNHKSFFSNLLNFDFLTVAGWPTVFCLRRVSCTIVKFLEVSRKYDIVIYTLEDLGFIILLLNSLTQSPGLQTCEMHFSPIHLN